MTTPPRLILLPGGKSCSSFASKTEKILNRINESMTGYAKLSPIDLNSLKMGTSIVKGTLAILLSKQASLLIKTSGKTTRDQAHLQILLQDMMDEIWMMETLITTLESTLKTQ